MSYSGEKSVQRMWDSVPSVHVDHAESTDSSTLLIGNFFKNGDSYLSYLKTSSDYTWWKERNEKLEPKTGQWVLKHADYLRWLEADSGPLLISAEPGCGKSVIARHLIESRFEGNIPENALICHYFFGHGGLQGRVEEALCALLHQIFSHQPSALRKKYLDPRAEQDGKNIATDVNILWTMFEEAAGDPDARPIIIVLDALDACHEDHVSPLLDRIKAILNKDIGNIKILMTSRPYGSIMTKIAEMNTSHTNVRIHCEDDRNAPIRREIELVVSQRIKRMGDIFNSKCQKIIKDHLTSMPQTTYLWCSLVLDHLISEQESIPRTREGIRKALRSLLTVDQAYEKILSRSKRKEETRRALFIVLTARRPLTLRQMQLALEWWSEDDTQRQPLELESDFVFRLRLRQLCGVFLTVHDGRVSFFHQSARQFLLPKQVLTCQPRYDPAPKMSWAHTFDTAHGHAELARICVDYLGIVDCTSYKHIRHFYAGFLESRLLGYALENWRDHLTKAHRAAQQTILASLSKYVKSAAGLDNGFRFGVDGSGTRESATNLMIACRFGLGRIVRMLLETGQAQPDAQDSRGYTALMYAVAYQNPEAVKILVEGRSVDVNARSNNGTTALCLATGQGNVDTVKILLSSDDIDPNPRDYLDSAATPLLHAAKNGYYDIVELLLDAKGIQIGVRDYRRRTAMSYAAERGFYRIVERMISKCDDRVINYPDALGRTALSYAAQMGRRHTLLLLLARGAVDSEDKEGRTALSYAAQCGILGVVQDLINLDLGEDHSDTNDAKGWRPQHQRSHSGFLRTLRRFLHPNGVHIHKSDSVGRTPLSYAAEGGSLTTVQALLQDGVHVDARDTSGRTALSYAAEKCNVHVVRLLLRRGGAAIGLEDNEGHDPMWWACRSKHSVHVQNWGLTFAVLSSYLARRKFGVLKGWWQFLFS